MIVTPANHIWTDNKLVKRFPLDLVVLDRTQAKPLYQQLYGVLRNMIESHALPSGMELPSSRELAAELNIARNTVIVAYDQLVTEGFIVSKPNARATVIALPKRNTVITKPLATKLKLSTRGEILGQQPIHHGIPGQSAFHPGMPDALGRTHRPSRPVDRERLRRSRGEQQQPGRIHPLPSREGGLARIPQVDSHGARRRLCS